MVDSPLLKIPLLSVSQAAKENTINNAINALERSMNDAIVINFGGGNFTLPETDYLRYFMFRMTAVGATSTLNVPASKRMFVLDNLMNANIVTVSCGTSTLAIPVGGIVVVYCDGVNLISVADSTIMGGGSSGPTTFIALLDTPTAYADLEGHAMVVKSTEDGLEGVPFRLANLMDVDLTGVQDGYVVRWDATAQKWEASAAGSGTGGGSVPNILNAAHVASAEAVIVTDLVIGYIVDGYPLTLGTRVLLKDQPVESQNGIWEVTSSAPVRPVDAIEQGSYVQGSLIPVLFGNTNGLKIFIQMEASPTSAGILPGTNPLSFETNSMSVEDLRNVDSASVANGYTLVFNSTTQFWETKALQTLPSGGTTGQILRKNSATEGDAIWADPSGGVKKEISFFAAGKGRNAETLCAYTTSSAFTISATGSAARTVVAATANTVYTLKINAVVVGTVTFAASSSIGVITFSSPGVIPSGGIFTVEGPPSADGTLADFYMTFREV